MVGADGVAKVILWLAKTVMLPRDGGGMRQHRGCRVP